MMTRIFALMAACSTLALTTASAQSPAEWLAARVAEATGTRGSVVAGHEGWLFFTPELRHLIAASGPFWGDAAETVSRVRREDAKDPLPPILAFHQALQVEGVRLIMVPVPAKATIYPEALSPRLRPSPRTDAGHLEFFDLLRAEGIEVLDLTERFLEGRDDAMGPLYCRQDSHWSGIACVIAANEIASLLGLEPIEASGMTSTWNTLEIRGDLWRMIEDNPPEPESLPLRFITRNGAPVEPDPESPILLLGDSHNLVFHAGDDMHARGAGLADQLAYRLGRPLEVIAVRGSGATPARINLFRRAQRDPDYWSGKQAVIWVFSVREFTESNGWREVPIQL